MLDLIHKTNLNQLLQSSKYSTLYHLIEALPERTAEYIDFDSDTITIGSPLEISDEEREKILKVAHCLIPWRKGPYNLFGIEIDSEWRGEYKWNRIKDHIPDLHLKDVLDIGTNNGYYLFKAFTKDPRSLLGIDPVSFPYLQYKFLSKYLPKTLPIKSLMASHEDLRDTPSNFDLIFSMGIIYHTKNPLTHLSNIYNALRTNGELIFETIGIPGKESQLLFPEFSYSKMTNAWFIPTLNACINLLKRTHFKNIEVISDIKLETTEQRRTQWCPPPWESLNEFLSPTNPENTIEGYPAPRRFILKAKKF